MFLGDENLKREHLLRFQKKLPDRLKMVDNLKNNASTLLEIHDLGHISNNEAMGGVSTVYRLT